MNRFEVGDIVTPDRDTLIQRRIGSVLSKFVAAETAYVVVAIFGQVKEIDGKMHADPDQYVGNNVETFPSYILEPYSLANHIIHFRGIRESVSI